MKPHNFSLNPGELYIGVSKPEYCTQAAHIILLPQQFSCNWKTAKKWAKDVGGILPNQSEADLLFKEIQVAFLPHWYWTSVGHRTNYYSAWCQCFAHNVQDFFKFKEKHHCCAIRRIPL